MRTVSLKLHDELFAQLATNAGARGMTKSALVREILERALGGDPAASTASCYDLARDLAGCINGLPQDLAGNPKHMVGFGE